MTKIDILSSARPAIVPVEGKHQQQIEPVKLSDPVSIAPISNRYPVARNFPLEEGSPFSALQTFSDDMSILKKMSTDEISFQLSQIYLYIKNSEESDQLSLDVRQGLKAVEEQIRLFELLHTSQTTLIKD